MVKSHTYEFDKYSIEFFESPATQVLLAPSRPIVVYPAGIRFLIVATSVLTFGPLLVAKFIYQFVYPEEILIAIVAWLLLSFGTTARAINFKPIRWCGFLITCSIVVPLCTLLSVTFLGVGTKTFALRELVVSGIKIRTYLPVPHTISEEVDFLFRIDDPMLFEIGESLIPLRLVSDISRRVSPVKWHLPKDCNSLSQSNVIRLLTPTRPTMQAFADEVNQLSDSDVAHLLGAGSTVECSTVRPKLTPAQASYVIQHPGKPGFGFYFCLIGLSGDDFATLVAASQSNPSSPTQMGLRLNGCEFNSDMIDFLKIKANSVFLDYQFDLQQEPEKFQLSPESWNLLMQTSLPIWKFGFQRLDAQNAPYFAKSATPWIISFDSIDIGAMPVLANTRITILQVKHLDQSMVDAMIAMGISKHISAVTSDASDESLVKLQAVIKPNQLRIQKQVSK